MNKRALLKFIIIFVGLILSIKIMINFDDYYSSFNPLFLIDLGIALTVIMFKYKDKIKKRKFIYDVILLLLMFFSCLWIGYLTLLEIQLFFEDGDQSQNMIFIFEIVYPILLFIITIVSFIDIFKKTNKTNDILCIITFTVLIIIYSRVFLDLNLNDLRVYSNNYHFDSLDYEKMKDIYINNNYLWFNIMIIILLVHHKIFNENKITIKLK